MADVAIELAEALKDALNDGSWSQTFTATREYDLTAELQDDDEAVHVAVSVRSDSGEIETRGATESTAEINIVVRQKNDCTNAKLDALMLLLLEFRDDQVGGRLTTATQGDAFCEGWTRQPAYYPRHIRDFRQFTGLLTLTFSLTRAIP